jgi:hypothetical protein
MPTISEEDLLECIQLVHRKWSEAFDNLKVVKQEKPNRKTEPDWEQFHAVRYKNVVAEEQRWREMRGRLVSQSTALKQMAGG